MYSWFQQILILWIHSLKWNSGIYLKKEWNSGPSISRFMMDTLCFFHVVLAFLLTLTVDRFETSTESENVFSDVSNLLQWFSDNHNTLLVHCIKWSIGPKKLLPCIESISAKKENTEFCSWHKYSLINPFGEEDSNEDDENCCDVRAASTKLDPFQALLYTGEGEKRGRFFYIFLYLF